MDGSSAEISALEELRQSTRLWRNTAGWYMTLAGMPRLAVELMDCSDPERAFQALVCPDGHQEAYKVIVPTCHLPYCAMCARRRAAELAKQYTPIVQDALNASPDTHRLRHITLTTGIQIDDENADEAASIIWNKAIRCFELAFGVRQRDWKKKDIGVLGGWEFGGEGRKLHLHAEVLSPWVDQAELSNCWKFVTGGLYSVVWITKVNSVENGTKEVTKYATKLTELSPEIIPTLHKILSGKRRIRAYGAFSWQLKDVPSNPMTCPICQQVLVLDSLLKSRRGNNFVNEEVSNPAKVPQMAAHPPPLQYHLPLERDFTAFYDTFESRKR